MKKEIYIYIVECDISVNDPSGINERGFVKIMLKELAEQVICILPRPKHPENFSSDQVVYVRPLNRRKPIDYFKYKKEIIAQVKKINEAYSIKACIIRPGLIPVLPYFIHKKIGLKIILKLFEHHRSWAKRGNVLFELKAIIKFFLSKKNAQVALAADCSSFVHKHNAVLNYGMKPEDFFVIKNGADSEFFDPQKTALKSIDDHKKFDQIIGYIGGLTKEYRGIEKLIEAAKWLDKGTGVFIYGKGSLDKTLQQLINDSQVNDRVFYRGGVPFNEVPEILNSFDITIDLLNIPFEIKGQKFVGAYSQKPAQFLAMGKPIIAWDLEDNEFIRENDLGKTATLNDAKDLAKKINLLTQEICAQEINPYTKRCREYFENHLSNQTIQMQRFKMWEKVIKQQHTPKVPK